MKKKQRTQQSRNGNKAKRVVGRPFPPGVSGNPGGRPRGLVRAIRENTNDGEELVDFILKVFRGKFKNCTIKDRMAAATWLADRCYGKPPIAFAVSPPPEQEQRAETEALESQIELLTDEQLLEIEAIVNRPDPVRQSRASPKRRSIRRSEQHCCSKSN